MSRSYVFPSGKYTINNVEAFHFKTKSSTGKETTRYLLKGADSVTGNTRPIFVSKAVHDKYGKSKVIVAKAKPKKKTCEEKFEECKTKKSAKKSTKKAAKKSTKSPKKAAKKKGRLVKRASSEY